MARSWRDAFDTGEDRGCARPRPRRRLTAPASSAACARASRAAARRSTAELSASFTDQIDESTWERLEEALILADVGAKTTAEVVQRLEDEAAAGDLSGGGALRERLIEVLAEVASPRATMGAGSTSASAPRC